MKTFKDFILIEENIRNVFKKEDKEKYKQEVWDILQNAYKKVKGGLQGSGFRSPDEMVDKITMWKLGFRNNKLVSVAMYKDKFGRKRVAIGTVGKDGIRLCANVVAEDFQRAYGEQSGPGLKWTIKYFNDLYKRYRIPAIEAVKILKLKEGEYKIVSEYEYSRKIAGGEWHTKEMMGTPGNKIEYEN